MCLCINTINAHFKQYVFRTVPYEDADTTSIIMVYYQS